MLYQLRHHRVPTTRHLGPLVQFVGELLVPRLQAAGIEVIGCFTALTGPHPRFSTLLAFPDANAWRDQLDAFEASNAWREIEPGLYPDGKPLVSSCQTILLRPTDFSMDVRDSLGAPEPGIFEERIYYAMDARAHARNLKRTGDGTMHLLRSHGIHLVAYWDVLTGADQYAMYYLVRYSSLDERMAQWAAFVADSERVAFSATAEAAGPLMSGAEANFLQPTAYSPLR
jgi:hypothetical protein